MKKRGKARDPYIEKVLVSMHDGISLRQSCVAAGTNAQTFLRWVSEDTDLAERYTHAREALIDKVADDTLLIADEPVGSLDNGATDSGAVAKQRLQVDTRKWLLSKLAPQKYGDKLDLGVTGDMSVTILTGVPDSK
jgi:hypothetical protein